MQLSFSKYQGTGNDFIILDGWNSEISISAEQVKYCCDRRFGIGADGLMIIRKHPTFDFEMIYFNSDGLPSSMCGNGGRCLVHFAFKRKYIGTSTQFLAIDGVHEADVLPNDIISLKMNAVSTIEKKENDYYLNTGSPHFVLKVDAIQELDVVANGRKIRNNEEFKSEGTNVNFVQEMEDGIMVRTYERGVENETLSCGTGVTAAALVAADLFNKEKRKKESINIKTLGGALKVTFNRNENLFDEIRLIGPAIFVYEGVIKL
ncbi:MAG: diaminopimelate epimerase [Bacteroidia bacterium]|jgi:diaminopimelate epimerase|nr:diaminopimelate epimerase [Bacteroidia bacterium]MBP7245627.1 diaminopimelate epimerase [Bacteroidia bacterium]